MDIQIDVPDGVVGEWAVETFTVSEDEAKLENLRATIGGSGRHINPGKYKRLTCNRTVVMSNTPAEIRDHIGFIHRAKECEQVLINGLGLGVALKAILESPKVRQIWVVEKSNDVIELVGPTYLKDPRVVIIEADAYEYKPPKGLRYGACWHDIWSDICADNLEGMKKLHRKYGRRCEWQGSWCRSLCEYHNRRNW